MTRFYITPSIFWEIENNKGKFTIAWLFIYFDIKFRVRKEQE